MLGAECKVLPTPGLYFSHLLTRPREGWVGSGPLSQGRTGAFLQEVMDGPGPLLSTPSGRPRSGTHISVLLMRFHVDVLPRPCLVLCAALAGFLPSGLPAGHASAFPCSSVLVLPRVSSRCGPGGVLTCAVIPFLSSLLFSWPACMPHFDPLIPGCDYTKGM